MSAGDNQNPRIHSGSIKQRQVTVDTRSSYEVKAGLINQIVALGGRSFRPKEYLDQLQRMSTEQLRQELAAVATEQWSISE